MGIKILTDGAICMCPHGGQLKFIVTHKSADGADGEVLTLRDYGNAIVAGCGLPPIAGGPCMKVAMVVDPVGQVMKVKGDTVVTQMVISMTDKGWPIMVVNPGMSAISINYAPVGFIPRKPGQSEADRQKQILEFGKAQADTLNRAAEVGAPFCEECNRPQKAPAAKSKNKKEDKNKEVISAEWGQKIVTRHPEPDKDEIVKLIGYTKGFSDGTPATLEIFEHDADGGHDFIRTLTSTVQNNKVNAEWKFEYVKDVDDIPDVIIDGKPHYCPEYIFDLKVEGKTARSGLLRFVDWVEVKLVTEEGKIIPNAEYIAYFSDGSEKKGKLDNEGKIMFKGIPPGKIHIEFPEYPESKDES